MGKYKVCNYCHIAFDKKLRICPDCGREIKNENNLMKFNKEGEGRKYHTGGEACEYCSHCYGSANWCPVMDS